MKEKEAPKGSRIGPPRRPPTAVGASPEPGGTAPSAPANWIIAVCGSTPGVGASTIALNLGAIIGGAHGRPAVVIPFDHLSYDWMRAATHLAPLKLDNISENSSLPLAEPGLSIIEGQDVGPPTKHKIETLSDRYHIILDLDPRNFGGLLNLANRVCWITTPEKLKAHHVDNILIEEESDSGRNILVLNTFKSGVSEIIPEYEKARKKIVCETFPEDDDVRRAGQEKKIFLRECIFNQWMVAIEGLHMKCTRGLARP